METSTIKPKVVATFAVILFALTVAVYSCKKDNGPGSPDPNEIWIQSNSLNPSSITVDLNSTVLWRNKDGAAHTITSDSFSSGNIAAGGIFTHQFTEMGTYTYQVSNQTATGTLIVGQPSSTGNTGATGTTGTTGTTGYTGYVP